MEWVVLTMPISAPKPCTHPGCPVLVKSGRCEKHQKHKRELADRDRGNSAARGYGRRWRKARLSFLKMRPLCVRCQAVGKIEPATVVDHIKPHRGDKALFWDVDNWQALCKPCHDNKTATEDGAFGR